MRRHPVLTAVLLSLFALDLALDAVWYTVGWGAVAWIVVWLRPAVTVAGLAAGAALVVRMLIDRARDRRARP